MTVRYRLPLFSQTISLPNGVRKEAAADGWFYPRDATEAALLQQIGCTSDDTVSLPDDSPAMIRYDSQGNPYLVDGGGSVLYSSALVVPPQIAPEDYAIVPSTLRALSLPNIYPGQSAHVVHPTPRLFPNGFGGYRYWLAFTPYPDTNSDFENPCIVASNDAWGPFMQPVPNPLANKPSGGYNADPTSFTSPDLRTLYLAYRERVSPGSNSVKVQHTADGLVWSAPVTVSAGAVGTVDLASPSIWWNGTGWTMISHNLDAAAPWPVQRRVSLTANIYDGFGPPSAVAIAPLAGRAWWHSHHERMSSGQVVALCQDNAQSAGSAGNQYWAVSSDDGASYQVASTPLSYSGVSRYRSAFCMEGDTMHLFLGAGLTGIDYVRAVPGRLEQLSDFRGQIAGQLAGAAVVGNALWADTCIRADSGSLPGTATNGGTYTVSGGTWGIGANQLYPVASGRLLASVGSANHRVQVQYSAVTAGIQQWLLGRVVDASNYWRVGIQAPSSSGPQTVGLQVVIAGVATDFPGVARCLVGDYLGLDFSGTRVRVLVNGQAVYEMQSAQHVAGTSIGLQANAGATTRYRNVLSTAN